MFYFDCNPGKIAINEVNSKFNCINCSYITYNKSVYSIHLFTAKLRCFIF